MCDLRNCGTHSSVGSCKSWFCSVSLRFFQLHLFVSWIFVITFVIRFTTIAQGCITFWTIESMSATTTMPTITVTTLTTFSLALNEAFVTMRCWKIRALSTRNLRFVRSPVCTGITPYFHAYFTLQGLLLFARPLLTLWTFKCITCVEEDKSSIQRLNVFLNICEKKHGNKCRMSVPQMMISWDFMGISL